MNRPSENAAPAIDALAPEAAAALAALADKDGRIRINPETAEQDLARLVLGIAEFLRQLMELQALRRLEAGSLTPDEEEALGLTLMKSGDAIRRIAEAFGLDEQDIHLDLGPLGRLT